MVKSDSLRVVCPSCKTEFELAEALLAPLRMQLVAELRPTLETEAKEGVSEQLKELQESLQDKEKENRELKKNELDLRKQREKLEQEREDLELVKQRELDVARAGLRKEAEQQAADRYELKLKEQEETIARMRRDLDAAKQRSEPVAAELRGSVQELALDQRLAARFPDDEIVRVAKGQPGADVIQRVRSTSGSTAGTILWESKRAKQFSKTWIPKLRENMRRQRADVAVLVSSVSPDGTEIAGVDGVWVVSLSKAEAVAEILREGILAVARAKAADASRENLSGLVYDYVTGPHYRDRIVGVLEYMKREWAALHQERAAQEKRWAEREEGLKGQARHLAGLVGDLEGIGAGLSEMPLLELPST